MSIQQFTISFWFICQSVSYWLADYSEPKEPTNNWDHFGWLWYKVGVLLLIVCASEKKDPAIEKYWQLLGKFFVVKIGWNIIAICGGWNINDPIGVQIIFAIFILFLCYLIIQNKWQRSKKFSRYS